MDQTFNDEYRNPEGDTGIDLDFDLDDDEFEDESGDLLRILGIAGGVAALVGGLMILLGRKRETPSEQLTKDLRKAVEKQDLGEVRKAVQKADLSALLSEARERANQRVRDINVQDLVSQAPQVTRQLGDTVSRAAGNVDLEAAELIFGELIGNVVRHAPGPIDVQLSWGGNYPVLHVTDRGRGFIRNPSLPVDPLSESGRGLYIIALLARDVRVERIPGYGNHVAVELNVPRASRQGLLI